MATKLATLLAAMTVGLLWALPTAAMTPRIWSPEAVGRQTAEVAAGTSFAKLEAFGRAALATPGEAGLDRLNHVAWLFLNQSEFDRFNYWNSQLLSRATAQNNARYTKVSEINALRARFDGGDQAAGETVKRLAGEYTDWFARAHAKSTAAYILIIQKQIGPALRLIYEADAEIPDHEALSGTAHGGVWESLGLALIDLHDLKGAATAFGRQQFEFMPKDYPRPDFDGVYNMAKLAADLGETDLATALASSHHRLTQRLGLKGLNVWDAGLCARVAETRHEPVAVLGCLAPLGEPLKDATFLAPQLLQERAVARARTGDLDGARRDWARLKTLQASKKWSDSKFPRMKEVEGEVLLAEGHPAQAFAALKAYTELQARTSARNYSDGIGQLTAEMGKQLGARAAQLATARRYGELQRQTIQSQHMAQWVWGVVVVVVLGLLGWQLQASRALRLARRSAESASRAKSEFLANMSHEIRTPLNGVVAAADMLSRANLPKAQGELIGLIQTSADTLQRLLSDILDLARIESGKLTLEAAPFQLGETCRSVAELWKLRCDEKGLALVLSIARDWDTQVMGDEVRIRQVLNNFLSNAIKFTDRGRIELSIENAGEGMVRLRVTDSGVGFESNQKALVLQRFQQADATITRRYGGTGLGLSICCELARMMGGTLDCEAAPGKGASFWVDIPLQRRSEADARSGDAEPAMIDRPLRILAADDHPTNRRILELMLDGQAEVICVDNGLEALELLKSGPSFDLVLMDMQMPVMDGLTAVRAIRADEAGVGAPRLPVIMLTANAMPEHVAEAQACGADLHLAKPFTAETLFGAIGEVLASDELRDAA
jgi:signal transduction histidine kinase/ActR/RegA family two-component response regulator